MLRSGTVEPLGTRRGGGAGTSPVLGELAWLLAGEGTRGSRGETTGFSPEQRSFDEHLFHSVSQCGSSLWPVQGTDVQIAVIPSLRGRVVGVRPVSPLGELRWGGGEVKRYWAPHSAPMPGQWDLVPSLG